MGRDIGCHMQTGGRLATNIAGIVAVGTGQCCKGTLPVSRIASVVTGVDTGTVARGAGDRRGVVRNVPTDVLARISGRRVAVQTINVAGTAHVDGMSVGRRRIEVTNSAIIQGRSPRIAGSTRSRSR